MVQFNLATIALTPKCRLQENHSTIRQKSARDSTQVTNKLFRKLIKDTSAILGDKIRVHRYFHYSVTSNVSNKNYGNNLQIRNY